MAFVVKDTRPLGFQKTSRLFHTPCFQLFLSCKIHHNDPCPQNSRTQHRIIQKDVLTQCATHVDATKVLRRHFFSYTRSVPLLFTPHLYRLTDAFAGCYTRGQLESQLVLPCVHIFGACACGIFAPESTSADTDGCWSAYSPSNTSHTQDRAPS